MSCVTHKSMATMSPQHVAGRQRIDPLLGVVLYRLRAEGTVVLRAGDHVDAHVIRKLQIVPFAVRVRQAAALLPVFGRSLGVKNQRIGLRSFKNSIAPARLSIFDDVVSVRKKLGIELIGVLLR